MDGEGFEPSKAVPTDLQSAPFGHSGIHPFCNLEIAFQICSDNIHLYHMSRQNARNFSSVLVLPVLLLVSYAVKSLQKSLEVLSESYLQSPDTP